MLTPSSGPVRASNTLESSSYRVTHVVEHGLVSGFSQDVVIDASDEDLPAEWVKKRRSNGSIYYFNAMDGRIQDRSPNEYDSAPGVLPPQRQSALQRMWQVRGMKRRS